jgi:hypothetical protein
MRFPWKRVVMLALVLQLAFMSVSLAFEDVDGDGFGDVILELKAKGVVHGDGKSFGGDRVLTLAEGLAMMARGLKLSSAADENVEMQPIGERFDRVEDGAWYADAFRAAAQAGLDVPRDADPAEELTRERYLHLLLQALQATGDYPFTKRLFFVADADDMNPDYAYSIQLMLNGGFVQLDEGERLHPKKPVTRRDAAVMLRAVMDFAERHGKVGGPGAVTHGCPAGGPADGTTAGESVDGTFGESVDGTAGETVDGATDAIDDGPALKDEVTCTVEPVNDEVVKVILSRGEKPNSGYRIEIAAIVFPGDEKAEIQYRLLDPEPGRMYLQVITYPTAAAFVPAGHEVVLKQVN